MFEHVDGDRLRLLIRQLDLEVLIEGASAIIDVEIGLGARAFNIEGVAAGDLDRVLGGRMVMVLSPTNSIWPSTSRR